MKKLIFLLFAVMVTSISLAQSVEVKDSINETLITINDEGLNKSSITIQNSGSAPGILTNKLYNVGHSLFWNGSLLGTGGSSVWSLNGTNAYYNSGKVGIGTTNPVYDLDILDSAGEAYLRLRANSASSTIIIDKFSVAHTGQIIYQQNHDSKFYTGLLGNNNYRISTSPGSLSGIEVQENGNVYIPTRLGIGTNSPGTELNVVGNVDVDGDVYVSTNVGIGTTNPISKLSVGEDGNSNTAVYFQSDLTTAIYGEASNDGDVANYGGFFKAEGESGRAVYGIAPHTAGANYGGYFQADGLQGTGVYGYTSGVTGHGVYGYASSAASTNYGGYFRSDAAHGRGVNGVADGVNAVGARGESLGNYGYGVIGSTRGNHGIGVYGFASGSNGTGVEGAGILIDFIATGDGVNYASSSSIRWKRNIAEIEKPLEKISQLRGVYFDWDEEHGGLQDIGCIAEEVGKVLPEIVVYEENGIDADAMDYSKLSPLLVEAVKALITENKKMKMENEQLKQRLDAIENKLNERYGN